MFPRSAWLLFMPALWAAGGLHIINTVAGRGARPWIDEGRAACTAFLIEPDRAVGDA